MPRRIYNSIPASSFKLVQLSMPIALDALNRPEFLARIIPTIKQRHLMPPRVCRGNKMSSQESCPTKD